MYANFQACQKSRVCSISCINWTKCRATGVADHILPLGDWFCLFWPILNEPSGPRVAKKYSTMVSPCFTYDNQCPNIRVACSINFLRFLNTLGGQGQYLRSLGQRLHKHQKSNRFLKRHMVSGSRCSIDFIDYSKFFRSVGQRPRKGQCPMISC